MVAHPVQERGAVPSGDVSHGDVLQDHPHGQEPEEVIGVAGAGQCGRPPRQPTVGGPEVLDLATLLQAPPIDEVGHRGCGVVGQALQVPAGGAAAEPADRGVPGGEGPPGPVQAQLPAGHGPRRLALVQVRGAPGGDHGVDGVGQAGAAVQVRGLGQGAHAVGVHRRHVALQEGGEGQFHVGVGGVVRRGVCHVVGPCPCPGPGGPPPEQCGAEVGVGDPARPVQLPVGLLGQERGGPGGGGHVPGRVLEAEVLQAVQRVGRHEGGDRERGCQCVAGGQGPGPDGGGCGGHVRASWWAVTGTSRDGSPRCSAHR